MRRSFIYVGIQFACIIFIMFTGQIFPANIYMFILLIVSALPGLWAVYEFGFNFSVFPEITDNHKLFTKGPYRFVRHPMYTSVILITFIWILNDYSSLRFMIWSILVIDLSFKLRYEEGLLRSVFPEYDNYKSRTKMFIPFIY
ncbi:MAG: isoprenylcysteine carboxylmethyltransferase family protein [Bacteroidetes bacterium]|nr:isoprenylcysteine carboxylmethyltransferase family protein [Bacteroidota bacterium]